MDPKIQELLKLYETMSLFDRVHIASFIPGGFYKDINSKHATAAAYRVIRELWESEAAEGVYHKLLAILQKEGPGAAKAAVDNLVAKKTSQGAVAAIARLTDAWIKKGAQTPNSFGAAFVATVRSDRTLLRADVKEEILKIARMMELPTVLPGNIVPAFQKTDNALEMLRKVGLMTVRLMNAYDISEPNERVIEEAFDLYAERSGGKFSGEDYWLRLFDVGAAWAMSGFPLVQVNDELAALFMAGDIPDTLDGAALKLPWPSFFLQIPASLRPPNASFSAIGVTAVKEGAYLTLADSSFSPVNGLSPNLRALLHRLEEEQPLLYRFLVGMLLYMNTPRTHERIEGETKERRKLKEARGGELPSLWSVRLSRPVKLDCRQWVRDYYEKGGSSPAVQSLIRGHWKRQPFGAGRSERKWTFISPYWRGKPTDPIAVREVIINEH